MRQTGQKYIFLRLIRAALLCVLPAILPAQQSKVIELRSADKLEGKVINGEEVRELLGHVYFVQPAEGGGLVHVWCDRALKYVTQNKMELFGHVKVLRDSTTLFSDEGMYYGNSKTIESSSGVRLQRGKTILTSRIGKYDVDAKHAEFTENVVLIDSTSIITCHKLHYYEGARLSIALDSGHVTDRTSGMQIFGDSLVHFGRRKTSAHRSIRYVGKRQNRHNHYQRRSDAFVQRFPRTRLRLR
jgi:hypothetical protein